MADEGGAGAYPGGPTYSEGLTPMDRAEDAEKWVPPTERISGPPDEPPD